MTRPSSILDLVGRFDRHRILVIGDPILDEYVTGDCTRLSPEAPIPVLKVQNTRAVPGGAANTAVNIAALGGTAVLVGVVGSDAAGQQLVDLAAGFGVVTAVVRDRRQTSRKVRALGGQQQLLRLDYEDDAPVAADVARAAIDQVRQHLDDAAVLVISDYAKGLVTTELCAELLAMAAQARVPVIIDPRPQHAEAYVGCDYLTPNWKEAQAMLGTAEGAPTPEAVRDVGRRLAERFRTNVLLTLGAQGLRFFGRDGTQMFDEPASSRAVFDVSGAGDTVVAAFALSMAAGAGMQTALRVANLAAGVVVGKVGTATVSRRELIAGPDAEGRIVDRVALARRVQEARTAGQRIALLVGAFDAARPGDLARIREARSLADVVIVGLPAGVGDDANRALVLSALRDVDVVHVFDDADRLCAMVAPDIQLAASTERADS